jgi:hypothetical protein
VPFLKKIQLDLFYQRNRNNDITIHGFEKPRSCTGETRTATAACRLSSFGWLAAGGYEVTPYIDRTRIVVVVIVVADKSLIDETRTRSIGVPAYLPPFFLISFLSIWATFFFKEKFISFNFLFLFSFYFLIPPNKR